MRIILQQIVVIAVLCSGLIGCKSAPRWDWWRIGRSTAPDSSPIARSAGPSLPSELAQQGDSNQLAGNMQSPIVDSGTGTPAYEQDAPPFSTSTYGSTASTYPSTPSGYAGTSTMSSGNATAGNYQTGIAGDPFARTQSGVGAERPGASLQRGPYEPNRYAAGPAPRSTAAPGMADDSRYGTAGSPYIGSNIAVSSSPPERATPWAGSSSLGADGVAAAGYQQASSIPSAPASNPSTNYPSTSPAPVAVSQRDYTGAGGIPEYAAAGASGGDATAGLEPGVSGSPSYRSPSYPDTAAQTAQTAQTPSQQPYRPGGTSDYAGPSDPSQISLAGRQTPPTEAPGQSVAPTAEPSTWDDRYGGSGAEYESSGMGRRY